MNIDWSGTNRLKLTSNHFINDKPKCTLLIGAFFYVQIEIIYYEIVSCFKFRTNFHFARRGIPESNITWKFHTFPQNGNGLTPSGSHRGLSYVIYSVFHYKADISIPVL